MPFDAAQEDRTTFLLLRLRDRLTAENWRNYPLPPGRSFETGRGCLLQQLAHVSGSRIGSREYRDALDRLRNALDVCFASDIGTFNDTHPLEDVQALVDKAIGR